MHKERQRERETKRKKKRKETEICQKCKKIEDIREIER